MSAPVPLTLDELDADSSAYDAAVAETDAIDRYCSSSDWVVPAARGLMPPPATFIRRGADDEPCWLVLGEAEVAGQRWLQPLEAMWGLASPLVGKQPMAAARLLARALDEDAAGGRRLLLPGMAPRSRQLAAVAAVLMPHYALGLGAPARRVLARIDEGLDAYLGRRSANLRRVIGRAQKRARAAGVSIEVAEVSSTGAEAAYTRLLAVDQRSWKGAEGTGLSSPEMQAFYRHMIGRLGRRGAVRLCFARRDGRDLGYIFGTALGDTYRGLQFGYDDVEHRLSLGNLMQVHELGRAAADGFTLYDFGSEVDYKRAWGDTVSETATLIAHPR